VEHQYRAGENLAPSFRFYRLYHHYFLANTTKDEKWLALVGRSSLAASRWRARRPASPSYFHMKEHSKDYFFVILSAAKNLSFTDTEILHSAALRSE
jgi:hypothetical protein